MCSEINWFVQVHVQYKMSKAEIVNVSDEPYVDPNDKIEEEEEDKHEKPTTNEKNPSEDEKQDNSPFKASSTIVPLEEKEEDENGFVPICSGTVGFDDPKPQENQNEDQNDYEKTNSDEVHKSACCLLI